MISHLGAEDASDLTFARAQECAQMRLHICADLRHVLLDGLLVDALIKSRVLAVHVDLVITKLYPLRRLLSGQDVKSDFIVLTVFIVSKDGVFLHLLPAWPEQRVVLHRLIQKVKRVERDLNVCGPAPRTLYHLVVEILHGLLALGRAVDREDEHPGEHLVEYDADGPHIDLVVVAGAAAPVRDQLLGGHHQRRPLE